MEAEQPDLEQVDADLKAVRKALRQLGAPSKLLRSVSTKAEMSQRRQTGEFARNRGKRWTLDLRDPQYAPELDCKLIHMELLGMVCEFANAPVIDDATAEIFARYIGHRPIPNTYRDALTKERLDYNAFIYEATHSVHGKSLFHIGHEDPTRQIKHAPDNVSWRSHRSNLIQGDMTLREARTKLVELIGRYFELGEVTIKPDEIEVEPGPEEPG